MKSWVEIAFDNLGIESLFLNWPDHDLGFLQLWLRSNQLQASQADSLTQELVPKLLPLFEAEHSFYEAVADAL